MLRQQDAVGLTLFDSKIRDHLPARSKSSQLNALLLKMNNIKSGPETAIAPILHKSAEGIKKSVDTDGGYEIDTTINEINRLKNTYEMKVLSQFSPARKGLITRLDLRMKYFNPARRKNLRGLREMDFSKKFMSQTISGCLDKC